MESTHLWNRRSVLRATGAGFLGTLAAAGQAVPAEQPVKPKGRIKQSICRWCYDRIPLDQLAAAAAKMGYQSIELLGPNEIKVVKGFGLTCAIMRWNSGNSA